MLDDAGYKQALETPNGEFMIRMLTTLSLIAGVAIGGALHAQEAAEGETEAEKSNEPTSTVDQATGLDLGQTVQEDPSYVKEVYDDWQLQCFRSDAEEDPCQMYQLLREAAGNPVAEFSIFKLRHVVDLRPADVCRSGRGEGLQLLFLFGHRVFCTHRVHATGH